MIDYYSYKISREEASKKILEEEEIYKNGKFKDKFKKFKNIWKHLKPYAIKYACRDEMKPIDLNEKREVAYFLNDNGEIGKGMYIAAAYENFIEWQNQFLDGIIEPIKQNGILHHFVKNIEKSIDIQKAKKIETLNFDEINNSFMETIYDNCKRNIFREDNKINYMNYKQFIYNFDSIEKYLGETLLPGKMKFNDHDHLKFITYCFEGFRGNKSSVLSDFAGKYYQKPLSIETKQNIYNSIKEKLEINEDLSKILFSIQLLIYYLTQVKKDLNEDIKNILIDLPEYVNISKECQTFLDKQTLKVEDIVGVYSYFELLCFKPIIDNLQGHYKRKIEEKKKRRNFKIIRRRE